MAQAPYDIFMFTRCTDFLEMVSLENNKSNMMKGLLENDFQQCFLVQQTLECATTVRRWPHLLNLFLQLFLTPISPHFSPRQCRTASSLLSSLYSKRWVKNCSLEEILWTNYKTQKMHVTCLSKHTQLLKWFDMWSSASNPHLCTGVKAVLKNQRWKVRQYSTKNLQ
jgi:hypothetical protein